MECFLDLFEKGAPAANPVVEAARLAAQVAKERIAAALPRSLDNVPTSASALAAGWLTPVLCRDVPGAAVVEFEVLGGSAGTSSRNVLRSSATTPPDIGPACQRDCS